MFVIKEHWKIFVLLIIFIFSCLIWYAVSKEKPTDYFTIAFLNIGQGDAIYIESPTHTRILVDGGPGRAILSELRKVIPFYVREIDSLIVTNPDKDHIGGFIDVLKTFDIKNIVEPGTKTGTEVYKTLEKYIDQEKSQEYIAHRGTVIDLGGELYLAVLYPDMDVTNVSTNDGSIIAQLIYGSTTVMLTGDAPQKAEERVLYLDGEKIQSDILKIGHHGSRTSSDENFVAEVHPDYAIISAGKDNSYGHPHQETKDTLQKLKVPILGTYEKGTIVFTCTRQRCILQ